jgi:hypothetical protein
MKRSASLVRKTSNVSKEALERLEKNKQRREDTPSQLALSDVHVADKVFQWRLPDEDVLADTLFVQDLVDALEAQEQPLQPFDTILVVPIGQQFFLVDGHHRLDAYATFGWKGPVPVEVFPGNLQDAILEAWKRNAHNKLPMTKASRYEAAWRLVKERKLTRRQITNLTNVKRSTLTNMRSVLEEFGKRAAVRPWAEARRLRRNQEPPSGDDWKQAAAREIALHLAKGPKQATDPELLAMALAMAKEELPAQLTAEWLGDIAQEVLLKAAEERGRSELQDDIDKLFTALFPGARRGFAEDHETRAQTTPKGAEGDL